PWGTPCKKPGANGQSHLAVHDGVTLLIALATRAQPDFRDDRVLRALGRELALHQANPVHAHPRQLALRRRAQRAGCAALASRLPAAAGEVRVERPLLELEPRRPQSISEELRQLGQLRTALPRAEPQYPRLPQARESPGPRENQFEGAQPAQGRRHLAQARQV